QRQRGGGAVRVAGGRARVGRSRPVCRGGGVCAGGRAALPAGAAIRASRRLDHCAAVMCVFFCPKAPMMSSAFSSSRRFSRSILACALAARLMLSAPSALAQATGASLRGQVLADDAPASGASVTATNVDTGLSRSVRTTADGRYVLAGLPPGTYRVEVVSDGQARAGSVTLAVGQTATLDLGVEAVAVEAVAEDATEMDAVVVTADRLVETRTSEIATYVSQQQIQSLPQGTRNFL